MGLVHKRGRNTNMTDCIFSLRYNNYGTILKTTFSYSYLVHACTYGVVEDEKVLLLILLEGVDEGLQYEAQVGNQLLHNRQVPGTLIKKSEKNILWYS